LSPGKRQEIRHTEQCHGVFLQTSGQRPSGLDGALALDGAKDLGDPIFRADESGAEFTLVFFAAHHDVWYVLVCCSRILEDRHTVVLEPVVAVQ
jgi:hypothetical protein